ncbi:hypothetical protein H2248_006105 [Termitomyces sp. 'cryptogamus']|nr:hypothetical protein H2248_006105 [Termitomyces sp. 'cryptogamus']
MPERYHGAAVGKGHQLAKAELEKLQLSELTTREAVKEAARILCTRKILNLIGDKWVLALSSSAMTRILGNVVGRSTTSTVASQAKQREEAPGPFDPAHSKSVVMNIFAGASDPWVIVPPKGLQRVQSLAKLPGRFNDRTLRRSMSHNALFWRGN